MMDKTDFSHYDTSCNKMCGRDCQNKEILKKYLYARRTIIVHAKVAQCQKCLNTSSNITLLCKYHY